MTVAGGDLAPLIGVDIGTTLTKATAFDRSGEVIAASQVPTRLHLGPDARVEQDVEEVVGSVGAVLGEVTLGGRLRPSLIAVTGQGDGCWLVDDEARPVRRAASWLDGRAAGIVTEWQHDGTLDTGFEINGNTAFPGAQAPLLRWLDEHDPGALERADTAAYCQDVVFQRLTGFRCTHASEASLPFGDGRGGYSAKALAVYGVEHLRRLLAPVAEGVASAPLTADGEAVTGVAAGTPVSCGSFDLVATVAGAGITTPGDALLGLGTTLACETLVDRLDTSGPPAGMHVCTGVPGRWVHGLAAMVGCASIDWVCRMVGLGPEDLDGCLRASSPGAGGVQMLPYLAPSGERAPFVEPAAHGRLTGLRLATTREDLVRAACEGVALVARDCFSRMEVAGCISVCGGGSLSREWLQVLADVLQRPLHVAAAPHLGTRGAVMGALAADRHGIDADVRALRPSAVVVPDAANAARYDEAFGRYQEAVGDARRQWGGEWWGPGPNEEQSR